MNNVEIRLPRLLPTIYCDRVRIREVLYNLIVNALKYQDKDEKWIEIGWQNNSRDIKKAVIFYVRDNGIGITQENYENIFRMFRRLQNSQQFGEGTGIGLTIVKKIIERHNGKIWVESEYGKGTTFYFTLGCTQKK